MPINQEFKKLIGKIKYEFSINQAQIADKLGVKKTYLSDMINGRVPYNETMAKKINEIFPSQTHEQSSHSEENESVIATIIKERFMQYLDNKGISPTKAEQMLGWGKGALIKAKSISADKTGEFLLLFNELSAEWLLRGEGDMIKKESSPEVEELLKYIKQLEALNMSGEALLQDKYEVIERLEKEIVNLKANISLLEDKLNNVKEAG